MLQFLLTLSDESGHGKIEHIFGTAEEQWRVNLDAPPQKQKRHPNGCRFCGGERFG